MYFLWRLVMDINYFLEKVFGPSCQHKYFYHFTDQRNEASILEHGLLSAQEIAKRGIENPVFGGNDWSQEQDKRCGMDAYVHLCFFDQHPMEYRAKEDGRIQKSVWFGIKPEIILSEGVLISQEVSNKAGNEPRPISEMLDAIDLDIIYTRTNWRDKEIQERLKIARKYELLIPDTVAREYIDGYVKRDG